MLSGSMSMDVEMAPPTDVDSTSELTVRVAVDRRKPSIKSVWYGMFRPRRRRIRRDEDAANAFLDWHPKHLLVTATAVLVLSLADGLVTVRLVSAGTQEINPLLAGLVHNSPAAFALVKWLLTACGVIALVVAAHARVFGRFRGATVLFAVLGGYALLVLYGLMLAVSLPS
jgi:hypothetical protein